MRPRALIVASGTAVLLYALAGGAFAAEQCRDDSGKFIKCPVPAAAAPAKCRDIQTKKFAKCGTPGTEPVPSAAAATTGKCRDIQTKKFATCGTPGTEPVPKAS